jgi:hypothetical protein
MRRGSPAGCDQTRRVSLIGCVSSGREVREARHGARFEVFRIDHGVRIRNGGPLRRRRRFHDHCGSRRRGNRCGGWGLGGNYRCFGCGHLDGDPDRFGDDGGRRGRSGLNQGGAGTAGSGVAAGGATGAVSTAGTAIATDASASAAAGAGGRSLRRQGNHLRNFLIAPPLRAVVESASECRRWQSDTPPPRAALRSACDAQHPHRRALPPAPCASPRL